MDYHVSQDPIEISVVIPTYNAGDQLIDCLSSLEAMDYPSSRLETIVVDDCSTDDMAERIKPRFPNVTVIRMCNNGGCDAARDEGIRYASGKVIAHTDTDCKVCPDWARRINARISDGASAVTGPVVHELSLAAQLVSITQFGHALSRKSGRACTFPGCNFAMSREALDEFGYRQKHLKDGSDRILAWQLATSGLNMVYDAETIVYHYPQVHIEQLLKRYGRYSEVTYRLRKVDPRLPGGWLLSLGPVAPLFLVSARLMRDYERLIALTITGRLPLRLVPALGATFPLVRALDGYAMLKFQRSLARSKTKATEDRGLSAP